MAFEIPKSKSTVFTCSNCCRNDSLQQHANDSFYWRAKINIVRSTTRLQHIVIGAVLCLNVWSFVMKVALSKLILWHCVTIGHMWVHLTSLHQMWKILCRTKKCAPVLYTDLILVYFPKHW